MPRANSAAPARSDSEATLAEDYESPVALTAGEYDPTPAPVKSRSTDDLFAAFDDTEEHLNLLYWGREGSGKTIDLAVATQRGKVLFVNAEGGLKRQSLIANGVKTENLVIFPKPGNPLTYDSLQQALFRVKSDLMDDPHSWFLVAFDSVTEVAQAFTDEAGDDRFEKQKRKNASWTPTIGDIFFTDLGDYGTSTKMVRKLVRMARDLPVHFAMTALERRDVDEDTSKVAYGPAVGPALQTSLLGYVDVVLYTKAADEDKQYFRAQTKKVGAARAKDRVGVMPKVLVNPTILRVLDYNEGILSEETDPEQAVLTAQAEKRPTATTKRPTSARSRKPAAKVTETPSDTASAPDVGSEGEAE